MVQVENYVVTPKLDRVFTTRNVQIFFLCFLGLILTSAHLLTWILQFSLFFSICREFILNVAF